MLVQDVACDGVEVGLRISTGLVVVQPKEAQIDLLNEIRDVGGGISHARSQVPPQLMPVRFLKCRDKGLFRVGSQVRSCDPWRSTRHIYRAVRSGPRTMAGEEKLTVFRMCWSINW